MKKIAHIFWQEYKSNLTRRSYLFFTFGIPAFILGTPLIGWMFFALVMFDDLSPSDRRPIGVIDQAELFIEPQPDKPTLPIVCFSETFKSLNLQTDSVIPISQGQVTDFCQRIHKIYPTQGIEVKFYPTSEEAKSALDAGHIQAYYDIQPDYWQTGNIILASQKTPDPIIESAFFEWVQTQLRARVPIDVLTRLDHEADIIHQDQAGIQVYSSTTLIEVVSVYLLTYFVLLGGSFTANYMFDSIASEAYDRTLEILITSVSPPQFLVGKLLGVLLVGVTQLGIWGGSILIFAIGLSTIFGFSLINLLLMQEQLWLVINVLLAAFIMIQVLAAALGLLQVSGGAGILLFNTFNWVVALSLLYATYFVPGNPHTPLTVAASLFPLSSPFVLLIRVVVTPVPSWQVILALIMLWGTNLLGLAWVGRLLKLNLLNHTASFSFKYWVKQQLVILRRLMI